jgi:hypothetical protein
MNGNHPETYHRKTWFGATARVTIGPGFLHRAGIGRVAIPHPPVANWLLRQGMPADVQRKLSFVHEFAHFQTAPVVLLSMIAIVTLAFRKNRLDVAEILILLAGIQALWEILSEGLVILEGPAAYHAWYDGIPLWPRVVFWNVSAFVVFAGGLSFVRLMP